MDFKKEFMVHINFKPQQKLLIWNLNNIFNQIIKEDIVEDANVICFFLLYERLTCRKAVTRRKEKTYPLYWIFKESSKLKIKKRWCA